MTSQDMRANDREGIERKDVDMVDAPLGFTEPSRPRKLEIRSGTVRMGSKHDIQEMGEHVARTAATYSLTHTTRSSHQETELQVRSCSRQNVSRPLPPIPLPEELRDYIDLSTESNIACDERIRNLQKELEIKTAEAQSLREQLDTVNRDHDREKEQLRGDRDHLKADRERLRSEKERLATEKQGCEDKAKQYMADLKDIRTRWKQTAKELNGLRAQGQGFYQVIDNYLESMIKSLRYNIQNFAIQHFSGELHTTPDLEQTPLGQTWKDTTIDGSDSYRDYIACPDKRPIIVQAFMWRIFASEISEKFRWAGKAGLPLWELSRALRINPGGNLIAAADAENVKKLHIWRGTTVGLILDCPEERLKFDSELHAWKHELFKDAELGFRQLQSEQSRGLEQDFLDIIDEGIRLDKEICRQVSRVEWMFSSRDGTQGFNPEIMNHDKGGILPAGNPDVALVIAPGVRKQGKSTGEGFESSVWLMKMEVSCAVVSK